MAAVVAAAAVLASALGSARGGGCPEQRAARPQAPEWATDLNGAAWPDFCYERRELEEHFFIIGDWGGIFRGPGLPPIPANDNKRSFLPGVDDRAQQLVAEQMKLRANASRPRYLLNVGDNFYWGGINTQCGLRADHVEQSSLAQWQAVYEDVYDGPLLGLPWLGVLGNHDYGGYKFTTGWDQAIAYTWGGSDRWVTPALYWSTKVHYADFTIDYVFVDSNVNDAFAPQTEPNHNMCSALNNPQNPTCGHTGPSSAENCAVWFAELWEEQLGWMARRLNGSTADWRIIVTHFPPQFRQDDWARLSEEYGVDLIVTGHRHQQEVSGRDPSVGGAAWVVSGGGGGIISEGSPRADGDDDQYGFFDVAINREELRLEALSHSGILRSTTIVKSRRTTTSTTTVTTTQTATSTVTGTTGSPTTGSSPALRRNHDVTQETVLKNRAARLHCSSTVAVAFGVFIAACSALSSLMLLE